MTGLPNPVARLVGLSLAAVLTASASPRADTTARLTLRATIQGERA